MKHNNRHIVLVKRKRYRRNEVAHGSWKIAYADFMTAMMAFFLVMWLISISNPQQLVQIADYFKTPLRVALSGGQHSSDSQSPIPGGGDDVSQQQGEVHKNVSGDNQTRLLDDQKRKLDAQKRKLDDIRLNRLRERLDQLIESDPRLKALRPHLIINLVEEGLRIQIIDSQDRPMFKRGSADVEPYMRDILRAIAPILNELPNKLSIAGHTDDFQYANGDRGYSNWELSADRANASRRELVMGGLDSGKMLRVVGMADTMKLKNRGGDDAVNRRISLLVLNHDTEQAIEKENAESDAVSLPDNDNLQNLKQIAAPAIPTDAKTPDLQPSAAAPAVQSSVPGKTTQVAPGPAAQTDRDSQQR